MALVSSVPVETAPPVEVPPVEAPTEPVVTPEVEASPEGDAQQPSERTDLAEVLKTVSAAELKELLAAAPPEAREEYEREVESRGEQRAQTRKKETEKATSERLSAWKPYVDNLPNAQAYVNQQLAKLKAGDMLDNPTMFEQANQQLSVGVLGKVVLENEAYVPELVNKYLPEMTTEEAQKLDKPLYKFGQTGMAKEAVSAIFEVAVERAKAEAYAEGVKKGEGNLQAKESLVEKLKKVQEIKQQGVGVGINGGAAPAEGSDAIQKDIAQLKQDINSGKITQAEYAERDKKLKQRIDALRS